MSKYILRDSSVGIVTGYRLGCRGLIPGRGKMFLHRVKKGSVTLLVSTGGLFPRIQN
jgi:hypothetical protein